nr:DUF4132 domain-containing protein [uncultured Acetatifactor sp.]
MINPQNQRAAKIVELLEQTNLFTADEIALAEDYLSGAAGEEALKKLAFRDLTAAPEEVAARLRSMGIDLINKGRDQEAERLAHILFAAGQSTCSEMMPWNGYYNYDKNRILLPQTSMQAAVYAAQIGNNEHMINRYTIQNLIKLAADQPDAIREAISYQKSRTENGKIILLMAYFQMKYPNVRLTEEEAADRQGGLLAGMNRLLGRGGSQEEKAVQIDSGDMALLWEYGEILANSLHSLYGNQMAKLEMDEIKNAVYRDEVDDKILKKARANLTVNRFILRILGGTAFVNYAQSPMLENVLKICLAADTANMLDIMDNIDLRGDLNERGGAFDETFSMDKKKFIAWAAAKGKAKILKSQFQRNREIFLECMKSADFDTFNRMNDIVKKMDPDLYQERKGTDKSRQQSRLIDALVKIVDTQAAAAVRDYLENGSGISALYPYEDRLQSGTSYRWGGSHWNILQAYQNTYGYDALSDRCEAFLMLYRGYVNANSLRGGNGQGGNEVSGDRVKRLFAAVDRAGLSLGRQLNGYADAYDSLYMDRWKDELKNAAREIFQGYLADRREEAVTGFREAASTGRCLGLTVLGQHPEQYREEILGFSQDSSKAVREELLEILYRCNDWEADMLRLLSSKKAAEREIAIRVLTRWDSGKYAPVLKESLEKEKNGKVRTLLETALHVSGADENQGGKALTREDLVKDLHKGGKKRSLAWAYETPFSKVHKKDGEEAGEEYLQALFLSYASMSPCGVSPTAAALAQDLDRRELAVYVGELFDKWMEAGAESKKRWVLYAASIHGGADMVKKLHHQIQEWPNAARGAIASEAVQALALSPEPQALLIVDGISRKFKFKQVKAAAGKALEFAAAQLGITTEELADRIVPDLGFNENMERVFDYGGRKFTVTITTALEIEVFDESGKKLKNLPAPGKRDDEEKAPAAYEEFKQMKKQMKATVSSQKMRLEMALSTGRQWTVEAWRSLFVKNPVMHQFATGLIWGIYEDGKLVNTFRYMEDGSFNTEDEDEFELPEGQTDAGQQTGGLQDAAGSREDAGAGEADDKAAASGGKSGESAVPVPMVGIVHPIELSEDSRSAWKEQLEDYEILQPIEQLDRPVYYRTEEEGESKSLERFGGCIVNDLSLGGKLMALGWYRGSVQDAGGFYSYYREDGALGVELHFSGSFVGGQNDDVTVYEARFYNAGGTVLAGNGGVMTGDSASPGGSAPAGIRRGSYVYDEANDSNSYCLKEIPERYFSEIVLQLAKATASSKEKDADWKSRK